MGSSVGPLVADIFLVHLEKKLVDLLKQNGVIYWKRYVDDTLAIIKNATDIYILIIRKTFSILSIILFDLRLKLKLIIRYRS